MTMIAFKLVLGLFLLVANVWANGGYGSFGHGGFGGHGTSFGTFVNHGSFGGHGGLHGGHTGFHGGHRGFQGLGSGYGSGGTSYSVVNLGAPIRSGYGGGFHHGGFSGFGK
ncbi:uncharacterized protein [Palaemon carinicauda]|uniref:uncharacterized protein n=1 Tax=Palaemon carinicauda TaxID=392227 RepID=UPI0035B5E054